MSKTLGSGTVAGMDLATGPTMTACVVLRDPLFEKCPDCGQRPDVKSEWQHFMQRFFAKCGCNRMDGELYTGLHCGGRCAFEAVKLKALAELAIRWNVRCSHRRWMRGKAIVPAKSPIAEYLGDIRMDGDRIFVKRMKKGERHG